jgi:hypothetical protein
MDIKCRKTDCVYNNQYRCDASDIKVSKDNACATYKKGENKKVHDKSNQIFKGDIEYGAYRHAKDICISCDSKCIFNRKKECFANGIIVNDIAKDPLLYIDSC